MYSMFVKVSPLNSVITPSLEKDGSRCDRETERDPDVRIP